MFIQNHLNDLTHSDALFELQQVVLAMSACLNALLSCQKKSCLCYVIGWLGFGICHITNPNLKVSRTYGHTYHKSQSLNRHIALVPFVCLSWLLRDPSVHFWQFRLTLSYEHFYCFCHSTKSKCLWLFFRFVGRITVTQRGDEIVR